MEKFAPRKRSLSMSGQRVFLKRGVLGPSLCNGCGVSRVLGGDCTRLGNQFLMHVFAWELDCHFVLFYYSFQFA